MSLLCRSYVAVKMQCRKFLILLADFRFFILIWKCLVWVKVIFTHVVISMQLWSVKNLKHHNLKYLLLLSSLGLWMWTSNWYFFEYSSILLNLHWSDWTTFLILTCFMSRNAKNVAIIWIIVIFMTWVMNLFYETHLFHEFH